MGIKKFFPAIKYTARDFNSIREELLDYTRRYYPDTYRDFSEAGFGSLMIDSTAYIGDILSFYLDYSANESFLDTAQEYDNILKLGKQMGYRFTGNPSSTGIADFFIIVPANASGVGPDEDYIPILKRGTSLSSAGGALFILNEDVNFSNPENEIVVANVNSTTGVPTDYAIKSSGQVISGELNEELISVGSYERLRTIELDNENITEIISVTDSEGNEYFEVDYLSQDIIFKAVTNRDSSKRYAPNLLKPFVVPRRFTSEKLLDKTILQFGFGSERDVTSDPLVDPSTTVLNFHSKNYVTDTSFDPTNLLGTDKLGISPSNTTLRIVYRSNTTETVNVSAESLSDVVDPTFQFESENNLNASLVASVRGSVEVSNPEPILGDVSLPNSDELKIRIMDSFSSQNRAVTAQDYRSLTYKMPTNFGAVKRVSVFRDTDSFRRNLNLYVISEDETGKLESTNAVVKENLKTWLNHSKMVNDTIDILDAKIVNIGINFVVISDLEMNKFEVLSSAITEVQSMFTNKMEIGEPFFITDIYSKLNDVEGVVDTVSVEIEQKLGERYSPTIYDFDSSFSPDGRFIQVPKNVVLEIKFPEVDIIGSVK